MFYLIVFPLVLLVLIHCYLRYCERGRLLSKIPGPPGLPIVGNFFEMYNKTPTEIFALAREYSKKYNGTYKIESFHLGTINLYEPEDVEIFLTNTKEIRKSLLYELFKPWLGDGLLTATGEKWHKRRKLLTPAFHFSILKDAFKIFNEGGKELVEDLSNVAGEEVDIHKHVTKFTLHSICQSAMGINLQKGSIEISEYRKAVHDMGLSIVNRLSSLLFTSNFIIDHFPIMKFHYKATEILQCFTNKVIDERRKTGSTDPNPKNTDNEDEVYSNKKRLAMLDLLLDMEKEGKVDQRGIQEEVDTFTFAGHDTTTSGIKFLLLNLANHREIQDRIVEELKSVIVSPDEEVTMNMVNQLPYLDWCIKESLRLYPPIHFISRKLYKNLQLTKYIIPEGTSCSIHIFDYHRNPKLYPDPLKYDPERFTPENVAQRHPFGYIPFSAGLRNCIGQKYAMFEMKSIVVTLLRKFIILPVTKPEEVIFTLDITLNTIHPIKVIFKNRTDKF